MDSVKTRQICKNTDEIIKLINLHPHIKQSSWLILFAFRYIVLGIIILNKCSSNFLVYSLIKTELITAYQVLTCVWTKKNILLTPQIVSFKGFLAACYKYFNQFRKFEKVIKNMFLIFYQFKYFVTRWYLHIYHRISLGSLIFFKAITQNDHHVKI